MKLNPPAGYKIYGGTSASYYPSADGSHFFSQCAEGPRGFGIYIFRQVGDGIAKDVPYGPLLPGRGVLTLGGNGVLYISGSDSNKTVFTHVVAQYVRYGATSQPPVSIPAPVVLTSDDTARALAAQAYKESNRANQRIDKLPAPTTHEQIGAIAWGKANDAIYASATSGWLKEWTWQKALDAAFSLLQRHGLVK
jgi:hypothetical protein